MMTRVLQFLRDHGRALLFGVALLSFVATVGSLVFGKRLAGERSTGNDSFAKTTLGTEAFMTFMKRMGVATSRRMTAVAQTRIPLVFVAPNLTAAGAPEGMGELKAVLQSRMRQGLVSVVVLPKWDANPMTGKVDLIGEAQVTDVLLATIGGKKGGIFRNPGAGKHEAQTVKVHGEIGEFELSLPDTQAVAVPDGFHSLVSTDSRAFVLESNDHRVFVISDPDIVHNWNLHRGDHAALMVRLLRDHLHADAVSIDEVFHGHGQLPSLGDALGRFPNVLLTIHGVVLCLLVVLYGVRRFGPPLPQFAMQRPGPLVGVRASAEAMVMGRGAPAHLVDRYVDAVIADVATRFALKATDADARAAAVDDALRASRRPPGAAALLSRKKQLVSSSKVRGNQAMLLARDAHAFRVRAMNLHASQGEQES